MDLREAKQILNEKGYELLDEGKFGRALAAGALALGLATGNANAYQPQHNYRNDTETSIQHKVDSFKDLKYGKDTRKTSNGFVVYSRNQLSFFPTKHIEGLNDDIVELDFLIDKGEIFTVTLIYEDGSHKNLIMVGKSASIYFNDEFDITTTSKKIDIDKAKQLIQKYYKFIK